MSCFKSVKISYIAHYPPDFRGALSKKNPAHYLKVIFEQFLRKESFFLKDWKQYIITVIKRIFVIFILIFFQRLR